jgi:hypothetical protein
VSLPDSSRSALAIATQRTTVPKANLRLQRERLLQRSLAVAVADAGDDAQFGPQPGQLGLQVGGEQRFVFGDQCAGVHAAFKGMRTVASVPPSASPAGTSSSVAEAP